MNINTLARKIVQMSIGEEPEPKKEPTTAKRGHARAAKVTLERRKAMTRDAAAAPWKR